MPLYAFLDEGGNFDFSASGTSHLTLTAVRARRPFRFSTPLTDLRYDLLERGIDLEYLHASNDRQAVRNEMFERVIVPFLADLRAEVLVVEKASIPPESQRAELVYPWFVGMLLNQSLGSMGWESVGDVIVITDRIPVTRKRRVVEKAVKTRLAEWLPDGVSYRLLHHDSKSCAGLQVADYINWAVHRWATLGDDRSLRLVAPATSITRVRWSREIK